MVKKLLLKVFTFWALLLTSAVGWGQCPSSVSVSSDQGNSICEDTEVTFTANVNGGTGPFTYQWKVNGTDSGTNSNTYTTSTLTNNQSVSVAIIQANGTTCTMESDGYTMTVNSKRTPTVNFSIPAGTKCIGQAITFTATNTNGGSNPNYEWFVNGSSVQSSTSNKLTQSFSSNGSFDIKVVLTSTITCYTLQTAEVSKPIIIEPEATISGSSPDITDACLNTAITPITFNVGGSATGATASGLPPGVTGSYISGTFTISGKPTATGSFPYTVSTSGPCSNVAASGTITVLKDATIALSSANNSQDVCQGEAIENIIYAIGETGDDAVVSGLPEGISGSLSGEDFIIGGSSTQTGTYNYSIYATGSCGNSQTLNGRITINENLTPTVSISSSDSDNIFCDGTEVTFTADYTNGGASPSFQWKINGTNSGSATSSNTFTSSSLIDGDAITVELTSSETCTTSNPVSSNSIVTTVKTNLTPTVAIKVSDSNICPGDEATFEIESITNEGTSPVYQWKVDGNNVGTNSATYSTTDLEDGQTVTVVITSSETCLATNNIESAGITIEVYPPPPSTPGAITGEAEVCSSATGLTYSITPVENATDYEWSFPNGWTITNGENTESVTVNAGLGSGNITVTPSNICGDSSGSSVLPVTAVNEVPANPGVITSSIPTDNKNVCPPFNLTFSVAGSGNYEWTLPTGWDITDGAGTNSISVTITDAAPSGAANVSVVAQNICGDSAPSTYEGIEINNHIVADFGEDQTICKSQNTIVLNGSRSFGNASLSVNFSSSGSGSFSGGPSGNNKNGAFDVTYSPSQTDKNNGQVTLTMTVPEPNKNDNTGNECGVSSDSMILYFIPDATVSAPDNRDQTVCINSPLNIINFEIGGGALNASVSGLPTGLSGNYDAGVFSISGTPSQAGSFSYTVTTSGDCTDQQTTQSGTIIVTPDETIDDATNKDQTVCINTAIASMAFPINSSVTNVTTDGLPDGVSGSIVGSDFVISGTPTDSGTFNYTLTTTGSCVSATTSGTLVVNPDVTISSPTNKTQEVCINTPIQNIEFTITTPGTNATVTGLPEGLNGVFDNGIFTISGSPSEPGTFEYSIETTGECIQGDEVGTITVIADPTATISYVGPFCTSQTGSSSVILNGTGNFEGGVFTSSPEGLTINSTSGAITPESSTPGTYSITYTGPNSCNAAVANTEVTITVAPLVEISYEGPFCNSDSNLKDPVFTNGIGNYQNGEFTSSQPGGLIIDKETGRINPQTSSPGTYDVFYTIDDTESGCELVTVSTEVIITQIPQITISYPEILCSSETSVAVTSSGVAGAYEGGTFTGTSGLAIDANGTIDASASTPGSHTVTYSIDAAEGCSEVIVTANFTIKEVPTITTHPVNTGVCSNSPAEFEVVATGDDLVYQWYKIVDGTAESIPGENDPILTFSNVTSADALKYYVVVSGNENCASDTSETVTLNVDEDIVISEPSKDVVICEDSTDQISFVFKGHANGEPLTFDWVKDGSIVNEVTNKIKMTVSGPEGDDGEYTGTLTIYDPEPGENGDSGVYWVIVDGPEYFTCSEAESKTFTFRVDPKPGAPGVTNMEFCLDEDAGNLTASGEDGNDIKWYTLEGETYTYIGDDISINTSTPATFEYYATQTRPNGCESDFSEPLIINVLDTPDPVSTEILKFEYCYNEEVTEAPSITPAEGATINWYGSIDATQTISAPVPNTSVAQVTTYYISQTFTSTGCESDRTAVEINIKQLPNVNVEIAGGENTICLGSKVTFNVTGADNYIIYLKEEEVASGVDSSFELTPDVIGENKYTVVGESNGCTNFYDLSIFVDELSDAGTLTPESAAICISDGSATLTLTGATGDITKWEYRNTSTGNVWTETEDVDHSAERTFTGLTETTEYRVTVKNGVCEPATSESVSIEVDSLPVAGELSFADFGRLYTTCEDPESLADLHLNNYDGQVVAWKYRTVNQTNFTTISGETEETLSASTIAGLLGNETLIFQAYVANGACSSPVPSRNAILSVISSNIEPAPVTVSDEVICLGTEVTLSAETGYESGDGIGDSGNFDNASINQHGWRIINAQGNEENFETSANNTAPNVWRRVTPREFTTASLNDPYTTGPQLFDHGLNDGNKGFALVSGQNTSKLETSLFTLDGMDEAILTFDQAYNLTPGASISVSIFSNGSWIQLYSNEGDPSSGNYTNFASGTPQSRPENKIEIDLGNYLGQSDLRIQFSFVGARPGDVWAVDNIVVPDGPKNVGVIWEDTTIDPENPVIIGYDPSEKWTPTKIGWNISVITTTLEYTGGSCKTAVHNEEIKVFVFDKYTTSVTADYGSCGNFEAGLTATVLNGRGDTITSYPTPDGYIGKWVVEGGATLVDSDPDDGIEAVNDPNAILSTGAAGTFNVSWILEATEEDENGELYVNPEACPPVVTPLEIIIEGCTALDFDGNNDYVDLGTSYAGSSYSIEAWIRPFDREKEDGTFTDASEGTIISGPGFEIKMEDLPSYVAKNNRWYHIAYTSGGALYIDGILLETNDISDVGGNETLIGARWNSSTKQAENHFSGWIEEVRIWKGEIKQDQIQFLMNQRLQNSANIGVEIPLPAPGLNYNALSGYFQLLTTTIDNGNTPNLGTGPDGRLHNMETLQENTAPLPYTTSRDNFLWTDEGEAGPWTHWKVWDIPHANGMDGTPITWNIVRTSNYVESGAKDIMVLGLIVESNELDILSPSGVHDETNSGQSLEVTHYLKIDGLLDLTGQSQLLQPEGSIVDSQSSGSLERDQQGTASSYNYNYWSSPVSPEGGNADYSVASVMKDGTTQTPLDLAFGAPYAHADEGFSTPRRVSEYWLHSFRGTANEYAVWYHIGSTGEINVGEGYSMKGTSGLASIGDPQNYTFKGIPNNGDVTLNIGKGQNYLIGNPYPSAIDANQFILEHLKIGGNTNNIFNGTLYFWDHFSGRTHYLEEYIGGYAMYNLSGSVVAISNDERINNNDAKGSKRPGPYVPVGQGFFINTVGVDTLASSLIDGGSFRFRNDYRIYKREGIDKYVDNQGNTSDESVFHSQERKEIASETSNNSSQDVEQNKIWLKFKSPKGYHRQILVTADERSTENFDLGFDAPLIEDNVEDMYWYFNNYQFVIQGVPDFDIDRVLDLGVKIDQKGSLSISIDDLENIPDEFNIYLADSLKQVVHDLREEPYETESEAGTFTDRFKLVFQDKTQIEEPEVPVIEEGPFEVLYVTGTRNVLVRNPELLKVDRIYLNNMLGQQVHVYYDVPEEREVELPVKRFSAGVYIVKVHYEGGIITKKVILE